MSELTQAEFWWMVGILEGEGFFDFNNGTQRISLGMTDLDTVERASAIFTKITGREYKIAEREYTNIKFSNLYTVHVFGEGARDILMMIVPHMGKRRRQRIWQMLNGWRQPNTKLDINSIIEFCKARK